MGNDVDGEGSNNRGSLRRKVQDPILIHECPRTHRQEMGMVFPGVNVNEMLVVPAMQRSTVDLSEWGDEQAKEKDRLLEQFVAWANAVREHILSEGHWAEFTDPASGYPIHSERGGMTLNDVDLALVCLKYPTVDLGVCKLISHPKWKTAVYPTSMVSTAPLEVLQRALEKEKD